MNKIDTQKEVYRYQAEAGGIKKDRKSVSVFCCGGGESIGAPHGPPDQRWGTVPRSGYEDAVPESGYSYLTKRRMRTGRRAQKRHDTATVVLFAVALKQARSKNALSPEHSVGGFRARTVVFIPFLFLDHSVGGLFLELYVTESGQQFVGKFMLS